MSWFTIEAFPAANFKILETIELYFAQNNIIGCDEVKIEKDGLMVTLSFKCDSIKKDNVLSRIQETVQKLIDPTAPTSALESLSFGRKTDPTTGFELCDVPVVETSISIREPSIPPDSHKHDTDGHAKRKKRKTTDTSRQKRRCLDHRAVEVLHYEREYQIEEEPGDTTPVTAEQANEDRQTPVVDTQELHNEQEIQDFLLDEEPVIANATPKQAEKTNEDRQTPVINTLSTLVTQTHDTLLDFATQSTGMETIQDDLIETATSILDSVDSTSNDENSYVYGAAAAVLLVLQTIGVQSISSDSANNLINALSPANHNRTNDVAALLQNCREWLLKISELQLSTKETSNLEDHPTATSNHEQEVALDQDTDTHLSQVLKNLGMESHNKKIKSLVVTYMKSKSLRKKPKLLLTAIIFIYCVHNKIPILLDDTARSVGLSKAEFYRIVKHVNEVLQIQLPVQEPQPLLDLVLKRTSSKLKYGKTEKKLFKKRVTAVLDMMSKFGLNDGVSRILLIGAAIQFVSRLLEKEVSSEDLKESLGIKKGQLRELVKKISERLVRIATLLSGQDLHIENLKSIANLLDMMDLLLTLYENKKQSKK